jgi:hypothetical protein
MLGLYPWLAASRADRTNLVRLFGYFGGPLLVDLWAAYFAGASLAAYGADADIRARLDLLVRMYECPLTDVTATFQILGDYTKLLKSERKQTAESAQTVEDPLPLDVSALVSAAIPPTPEVVEPAQTQEAAVDAA